MSDARMSMDFDDASWTLDLHAAASRRGSLLDQTFTALHTVAESAGGLDPMLTQTFSHTAMDTDDFTSAAFSATSMFNPNATADFKMSPEWMTGIDPSTIPYTTDSGGMNMTVSASSVMVYPEYSSETSTLNDDCLSVTGLTTVTTNTTLGNCNCTGSLQDVLSLMNSTMPTFDKFLTVNKSAVQRIAHCLSCHCLPDISSVMLLTVIITRIVQCYKKIRNGECCTGNEEVGVTMGMLKMDSEDEYQIKMVLIRSELRKIKTLLVRFRDRFENYLTGADRNLYEANMAFLEYGLDDTIKGL
jgi:hypothetical protein